MSIRKAYSQHFLRANRQGFTPLTFRAFVAFAAHAVGGGL